MEKAEALVNDPSSILPVPGRSDGNYNHMVASSSDIAPHLVTTPKKFTCQFKCDSKCHMYSASTICSHTVSSTEVNGKLHQFIQWFVKQSATPNLTRLPMCGIPKGCWSKGR